MELHSYGGCTSRGQLFLYKVTAEPGSPLLQLLMSKGEDRKDQIILFADRNTDKYLVHKHEGIMSQTENCMKFIYRQVAA